MERICKMCGKSCEAGRWVKGLCHTHHQAYLNAKKRLPNHLKRAEIMRKLIELVEGSPNIITDQWGNSIQSPLAQAIDTSGTNYVMPKK